MKENIFKKTKIATIVILYVVAKQAACVEFNTDFLDANDKANIDFSRFSKAGYITPGKYQMDVVVNNESISPESFAIAFVEKKSTDNITEKTTFPEACITGDIVDKIGLTHDSRSKLTWWNDSTCADFSKLPGVTIKPVQSEGKILLNIPQAWMEYTDHSWLPPSRWEDGISGFMLDYNVNGNSSYFDKGYSRHNLSYYGTIGYNFGAWRFRSDYQGSMSRSTELNHVVHNDFNWNRYYAYRALPNLEANLHIGENYMSSSIFESWRYLGVALESDERMLPPNLRGYAPQISGIAETNAHVVVSQQGTVVYDTIVPAGPFTIQDLNSSLRGTLDVEITEQNGEKKIFQVESTNIPYLSRPGQMRYKLFSGKSVGDKHQTEGPWFLGTEVSKGINNNWSIYGGAIAAGDYNSLAVGFGRDLNKFGTVSGDVTQSIAQTNNHGKKEGKSWRLSYSKRFDESNTDITFAGYRFTEKDYMSMQQFLDEKYRGYNPAMNKELYSVSVNKYFPEWQGSVNMQYNYQTYWDRKETNNYTLSLYKNFDFESIKNVSLGLVATRSEYFGGKNDSIMFQMSLPLGKGYSSASLSKIDDRYSQNISYSENIENTNDSYSITAGVNHGGKQPSEVQMSGFYDHKGSVANLSANFSKVERQYTSFGFTASGGMTLTAKGGAMHSGGRNGGTRMLIDTDGVSGVPVNKSTAVTNKYGIGVVTDINSYYRNSISVDLANLPDDIEATNSVVESVLTEGAIGYRQMAVLKGGKLFAKLRMSDGTYPPFGASVTNGKGRELGIVGEEGMVWLSGVQPEEKLSVAWDGNVQCKISIPQKTDYTQTLFLPCQ
ncbi:fimbria/pilus outer membrane usher protein [Escherichia coli]|uniref:fimbria/pilus outer membrane usher protein n=2 Tax=Escherichia coli TaxID=562 RepID=UPI000BE585F7|nr:fimbria/pilus outer membrane usher protein [Escherichia coli]EFG8315801.1 fimbria/pilus outer membrane usher protein [Escherichia coli]